MDEEDKSGEHVIVTSELQQLPTVGHFTDIGTATNEPPEFVIDGLLPVGITFVVGPPKLSRKSTLVMAMCCLVTGAGKTALPMRFRKAKRGTVLGLSAEATVGELRDMVESGFGYALTPDGSIMIADNPWEFRLDDEGGLKQCLEWLEDRKPTIFFLDPLRDFHQVEEKDDGAMNRLLRPIQRWAKANGSAAVIVHHTRKKRKEEGDYEALDMRGSTALFAIADGVIAISPRTGQTQHWECTFKRGSGISVDVCLGAWGETAREVMPDLDKLTKPILEAVNRANFRSVQMLATFVKATVEQTQQAVDSLIADGRLTKRGKTYAIPE